MTQSASPRSYAMLAMLLLVYILNFVDRQIISILAVPIQKELAISDGKMGLLGGLAFALFYTTLAVPIARLADRWSRTWIITVSLGLWSGFTALCGLATNYTQLFLSRLGVGVGEAGGVAPSYALISDIFPQTMRARALAIYSLGIPLGSAAGVMFGGWIAQTFNWRTAFIAIGLLGVLVAPFFRLVVREPARPVQLHADAPGFGAVMTTLARKPSFWLLSFGGGMNSMVGYGLLFWLPSFLKRSHGLELTQVGQFYGMILLVGGVAGVMLGGMLGDRLGRTNRGAYARVPALAFLVAAPLYALAIMTPSLTLAFVLLLLPQALSLVWLGPVLTAVQSLVEPRARATASAAFLLINNLIGLGVGSALIGAISTAMAARFGDESLRYAILIVLSFYLVAAALYGLASKRLARDWVD